MFYYIGMEGWILLHRRLIEWEWYTDSNTIRVFLHCLLMANHQDGRWQRTDIKRGQFITSLDHMSKQLSGRNSILSVRQIRTAIAKLVSTGELTSQSTNRYRIITVQKYNDYQTIDKPFVSQATSKRQADDKQMTTNNNDNNVKNDNNDDAATKIPNRLTLSRGQLIAYAKEYPGLNTTEIGEQRIKCNTYMNMSSDTFSNPGLFFRNWLKRYLEEKKLAVHKAELSSQPKYDPTDIPDISEEQRLKNIERIKQIKERLVNKL